MLDDTLVEEDIHPEYLSAGESHVGAIRSANQDVFAEWPNAGLWAVADGMGGYRDGDVAARQVCESLAGVDPLAPLEDVIDEVRQRISTVNTRLYDAAQRLIDPIVSGSTVAMLIVRRTACAVLWAGDSRVYRLRHRHLSRMTTDHTWASELNLSPNEEDHAITRAVGGERVLLLDVRRDQVRLGDRYLLCSDGLTHELSDEDIAELLAVGDAKTCARALIEATLRAGARDNVTVVVIDAQ